MWTEELSRFIFVWISYLAIPLAIKNRANIRVDIIFDRLPERIQKISWVVVDLCFLGLTVVITYLGTLNLQSMLEFPQTTPALQIPYLIPYLVLPIAFGLMTFRLVQDLIGQFSEIGIIDSLYGAAFCGIIVLPIVLSLMMDFELNSLLLLFGYFALFLVFRGSSPAEPSWPSASGIAKRKAGRGMRVPAT